ncbi:hypothetical protein CQW23_33063 [Capsicum baccatum]|uniref:Uncharacterized protein n=1 Tax=Capsicum baccatum TaxID=33114 RepID=A0A2G2V2W9_CAPBA|nr:hypothetical protein CQW23_33063 [Capsicum baccatum]
MRCGSCSSIIQFELGSKDLGASVPTQVKQLSVEFAPGTSDLSNENLQNVIGCLVNNDMIPLSDDYDNSSYHFNDAKLDLSEDEISLENVFVRHDLTHRVELPLEGNPAMLLDSSQNDHAYTISPKYVVKKNKKEDMKEHTDQERTILDRSTSRQNFIKDVSTEVEMNLTKNEFVHSGVSVESVKSSKDENLSKIYVMGLIL